MSTPTTTPVPSTRRRPVWKTVGSIILGLLIAFLCLHGIGSLIDRATGLDEPVTFSAGPSALPVEQPTDVPQQLSDEQLNSPGGTVVSYLIATPSYWNNFGAGGWADPVDTVSVEGDDVLINLDQPFSTSATYQGQGVEVLSWATGELRQHRDNATVAGVDLVAVMSADGVLLGYEKL